MLGGLGRLNVRALLGKVHEPNSWAAEIESRLRSALNSRKKLQYRVGSLDSQALRAISLAVLSPCHMENVRTFGREKVLEMSEVIMGKAHLNNLQIDLGGSSDVWDILEGQLPKQSADSK